MKQNKTIFKKMGCYVKILPYTYTYIQSKRSTMYMIVGVIGTLDVN